VWGVTVHWTTEIVAHVAVILAGLGSMHPTTKMNKSHLLGILILWFIEFKHSSLSMQPESVVLTLKRGSGETVYKKFGTAGIFEAPIRLLHFKDCRLWLIHTVTLPLKIHGESSHGFISMLSSAHH